ncbi:MAG TPA: CoA pyrophosphatase, partial [Thermoanaerobaculia bacterium]|nr:CoA pyrophosphatase [Thermoanaerobaculia bacterium]
DAPWMEELRTRFGRSWPARPLVSEKGEGMGPLRQAAVLIPLYVREKALWTLFTKRTEMVEHHKGQISFPGGGRSEADANLWETAIRETEEEIGVPRAGVRLLGALPKLVTVTDFEVSPFVGAIPYPVGFAPHPGEVESIIEVPLSYLLDPMVVEERPVKWKGRDLTTLVYHYRGHAIWGATARILADLLTVMREDGGSAARTGA